MNTRCLPSLCCSLVAAPLFAQGSPNQAVTVAPLVAKGVYTGFTVATVSSNKAQSSVRRLR